MGFLKKLLTRTQLVFVLSFCVCVTSLALTPPGTIILNRASVFYEILSKDEPQESISNATSVTVGSTYAFSVENSHSLNVAAGVVARFPHRIINHGNTEDSYQFIFDSDLPPFSDGVFDTPIVFHDVNSNGSLESTEPVIVQTERLQAGQSVDVIVTARVSSTLTDGEQKDFPFTVASELSDQTRDVIDSVIVGSPGKLEIVLHTDQSCSVALFPGDTISHSIEVTNAGFGPLTGSSYVIDDSTKQGLIVELPITENAVFAGFDNLADSTIDGIQVVQLAGFATNQWINSADIDSAEAVIAAGYFFNPAPLIEDNIAAFGVQLSVIDALQANSSVLTTAFYDADADGIADEVSNSTCNTFTFFSAAQQGELRFIQSAPDLLSSGLAPDFFTDTDFVDSERFQLNRDNSDLYHAPRDGVYLELEVYDTDFSGVQVDSAGNRYVISQVESVVTGDTLQLVLLQTSHPSVYRSIAPIELSGVRRAEGGTCPALDAPILITPSIDQPNPSCVLQSAENDELRATFQSSNTDLAVESVAFVSRQSVVFNSATLQPVAGAIVQIVRADNGEIATDEVTGVDFSFSTDSNGRYVLPRLEEQTAYYINVVPPAGLQFPSEVAPFRLTDFSVHGLSYGRNGFDNADDSGVFFGASINLQESIDIPLDPVKSMPLLSLEKAAIQSSVDVGQSAWYSVTVRNPSETLNNLTVTDTLPFGFRFVSGSVLIGGEAGTDPELTDAGLVFTLGELPARQSIELTYAARPTAAAIDGDGVNTVFATALTAGRRTVESLPATAKVTIERTGVFSDRAALFGKIYVDQNCDGIHSNKEWPIGGVRLYLQDGSYAITDADGLYSMYGLEPGRYVVQVDTHTLPEGLDLKLLAVEQLADADSRIVDLSNGDFHRADFAAGCPAANVEQIFAEIKRRNQTIDASWYLQHAERSSLQQLQSREFNNNSRRNAVSADGDLSSGLFNAPDGFDAGSVGEFPDLTDAEVGPVKQTTEQSVSDGSVEQQRVLDAKQIVATITEQQAKDGTWLWPRNNMSLNGRFMAVIRSGIDPTLYVNDKPVPATQIGERMVNRREKAQVVVWYGVELRSGENTVEIKGKGPFGNERILATGVFKRPSAGTQIKIEPQSQTLPADSGRSTLPVSITILDDNGYPALGVYYITLESSEGSWLESDIQDKEPGRQIRIENGTRTVYYRSSAATGEVNLRASTGSFSDQTVINQTAESRPLLVAGFVEAGGYFATEELGNFNASTDLGQLDEAGRFETKAALFVKGTVKEKYNLTLSYDSDADSDRELLRDINPTLYYPVHGDASIRGFEAQSRSKLYVRVERGKSSVVWGDYITDASSDRRDLARLNRTLTGLNAVFDDVNNRLRVFAAQEENRNIIEEIRGNGSALLYRLQQFPIVANSESVELITRSRDNPDLILSTQRLSRFGDYSVDDETGFLSFAATVPTLDAEQNPMFIRVGYDIEHGGDDYLVAGARFDRAFGDNLTIGASITSDKNDNDGRNLVGLYADYKLGAQTRLSVSLARSDSELSGVGSAHSLSVEHQWSQSGQSSTSLTHQWADNNFSNTSASVSAGRTETRLTHTQQVSERAKLLLEANQSRAATIDEQRTTLGASVETKIQDWKAKAGLRQIRQQFGNENDTFITSVLGASRQYSLLGKSGQLDMEYEQDLGTTDRRRIAAGAKLALHKDVNGYSRYEMTNSLLGVTALSGDLVTESFTLGVESKALQSTRLYSEYRMHGAFESTDFETASGVRGDYEIQDGLRISPHFEYIERLGSIDGDSVSASVGLTDTRNRNSRRLIRLETRQSRDTDHYGLRASITSRLNTDWTGLLSDNLTYQTHSTDDDVLRHSLVAALARRPKYENRHHMLFLYKLEQDRGVIGGVDRTLQILSTHQNLQIDQSTILSGRIGLKHDSSEFSFNRVSDFAMLADARLSFDLGRRLNLDTGLGALSTNGLSEVRYSLGMGLNYTLNKNLRLSFAYNLIGFRDEDLDEQNYNGKGVQIGLQYKLDEELFKWLE